MLTYDKINEEKIIQKNNEVLPPMICDDSLRAKICVKNNNFSGISLLIGTYGNIIEQGELLLEIKDLNTNNIVRQSRVDCQKIVDNKRIDFLFDKITDSVDKEYYIQITLVSTDSKRPITFWIDKTSGDQIFYNSEVYEGSLNMNFYYSQKSHVYAWDGVLFLTVALTLLSLFIYCNTEKKDENK